MNIKGFLRWQFSGSLKNPSFYGMLLGFLGLAMLIGGCPMPWPGVVSMLALVIIMIDVVSSWFRFSYRIYEMEQRQLVDKLKTKE